MGDSFMRGIAAAALSFTVAACSTTSKEMDTQPQKVSQAALCRSYVQTKDETLRYKVHVELGQRGIDPAACYQMVQQQNQAAAALVAVALVGGAVAYCANNHCGGGGGYRRYHGNCQYDWQYDAVGNRCGRRSAWSRPGGY
jgi:hypothetical protein